MEMPIECAILGVRMAQDKKMQSKPASELVNDKLTQQIKLTQKYDKCTLEWFTERIQI